MGKHHREEESANIRAAKVVSEMQHRARTLAENEYKPPTKQPRTSLDKKRAMRNKSAFITRRTARYYERFLQNCITENEGVRDVKLRLVKNTSAEVQYLRRYVQHLTDAVGEVGTHPNTVIVPTKYDGPTIEFSSVSPHQSFSITDSTPSFPVSQSMPYCPELPVSQRMICDPTTHARNAGGQCVTVGGVSPELHSLQQEGRLLQQQTSDAIGVGDLLDAALSIDNPYSSSSITNLKSSH